MNQSDVIEKIRKLLATKGRTEAEVDTAQILAAALAAKHGLDIAAIDLAEERQRSTITHRQVGEWAVCPYEATYASLICNRFFEIDSITRCGWTEKMVFIGTEWHIQIAEYVFNFLIKEFRWQWNKRRGRCRNRRQFIYGCYNAIFTKLHLRFADEGNGPEGLEISWKAKRAKYLADNFGEVTTSSVKPKGERSTSAQRGFMAGQDIEIRPGVDAGAATKGPEQIAFNSRLLGAPVK